MKTLYPFNYSSSNTVLFVFILLFFTTSCSFPKAVRLFKKNELENAEKRFMLSKKHKIYGCGAKYYLGKIEASRATETLELLAISKRFCECEKEIGLKPIKDQIKLKRHDAGRGDIEEARERLQKRIYEDMSVSGTITELLALEIDPCWTTSKVDSIKRIVVNKTINPAIKVDDKRADSEWKPKSFTAPSREEIRAEPGRSCNAITAADEWGIDYNDATIISEHYNDAILPANYPSFWEIKNNIWSIFEITHSYCEMDGFKKEHSMSSIAHDCWFDTAHDTLCMDRLKPLLAYHRNNPYTALDESICNQILCLNALNGTLSLNKEEQKQVEDIELMHLIQQQFLVCKVVYDSTELIDKIVYLAEKYPDHKVVFDLSVATINYFSDDNRITLARKALDTFRPLHQDSSVCYTDFYFQIGKQKWFDTFESLLKKAEEKTLKPILMTAWNTPNDEYALVSSAQTKEVFFVRKDKDTGTAQVMTSFLKKEGWTSPIPVKTLSISNDVIPLSMSADGKQILLKSEGKLLNSYRPDIGRRWLKPSSMPKPKLFAGDAWLSSDDSLLLMTYYSSIPTGNHEPLVDLAASRLMSNGKYGSAKPIKGIINHPLTSESKPIMALGGRMLFYVSDREDGLGGVDMYSVNMSKPRDWSTMATPINLGIPLNTIFDDHGLTYFSEYTGDAYFYQENRCTRNLDIWMVNLGPGIFPENAMRLAGLVLDENGEPLEGGFVEFTPNYQLKVHTLTVSKDGTYSYTVADSTEVVRVFPEIPGYFSERDTIHFLSDIEKGSIVRDTFRLTSFDYIRKNYKLEHSTFRNKKAEFDEENKVYPELARLAKIATRMGANLELKGHTDNIGTEQANKQLSFDRANTVKRFLVNKCGFEANKIKIFGYGSSQPKCDNKTEDGRRCNRRIDILFKMPNLSKQKK